MFLFVSIYPDSEYYSLESYTYQFVCMIYHVYHISQWCIFILMLLVINATLFCQYLKFEPNIKQKNTKYWKAKSIFGHGYFLRNIKAWEVLETHWLNLPNLEWKLFQCQKHVILTQIYAISTRWTLKRPIKLRPKAKKSKFYDYFSDLG